MAVSPLAVAKYFIERAAPSDDLTPMKLVKLCYIAHGWHLALREDPLSSEPAQAWKYGPVFPSVYYEFKHYGRDRIPRYEADSISTRPVRSGDTEAILEKVYKEYRHFDGLQLSTLTHKKGTPWYKVWYEQGGKSERGAEIPNALIEEHYRDFVYARH